MKLKLFPLVLFAATSLLSLKAFDMIFGGEMLLSSTRAYASGAETKDAKEGHSLLAPGPVQRPEEKITPAKGEESGKASLDERLGEKRRALEDRSKELDIRENLVKTAEKRLDEKMEELKKLEDKGADGGEDNQSNLKIKNLVVMYETMKTKNAADIFNTLDMDVMIEVVSRMKPQVTAQILAAMKPESAQKLTVEMARRSLQPLAAKAEEAKSPKATGTAKNPKELPRIDTPPPKQS